MNTVNHFFIDAALLSYKKTSAEVPENTLCALPMNQLPDPSDASAVTEVLLTVNITERQIRKFWNKIRLIGAADDDCWEWIKAKTSFGHGVLRLGERNHSAHRVAYFLTYGSFPDALKVCHKCDNPPCCNPAHLFLGTQADNLHDMFRKDRRPSAKGTRNAFAKLNDDQVREIRARYAKGDTTHRALAKDYGVCYARIFSIVRRFTWKHIL